MTSIEHIANHATTWQYDDVPSETVEHIETHVLDTFSAIRAGSSASGPQELNSLVTEWRGKPEGRVFVHGERIPLPDAAWVNTVMTRGFDFESTLHGGATHVPGSIIPAAIALAEYRKNERDEPVSGREFITAVTLGSELNWRFRVAGGKDTAVSGGWLAETFSPPAIAAMGGPLLDWDEQRVRYAMGIGYNQCCGTYGATVGENGGSMAQISQGLGTKAGILSVLLADRGFTANDDMIDGEFGLFEMYANGEYDREVLVDQLGEVATILQPSIKRYPGCGATQPVVQGVLTLVEEHDIRPADVEQVEIGVTSSSYRLCGANKQEPATVADALWNHRFSSAVAIAKGEVFVDSFTEEGVRDPEVLDLIDRIDVYTDDSLKTSGFGSTRKAEIRIETRTGESYQIINGYTHPDSLDDDDVLQKFEAANEVSADPLADETLAELETAIRTLPELDDVTVLADLMAR